MCAKNLIFIDLSFVYRVRITMSAVRWQIQRNLINLLVVVQAGRVMSSFGNVRVGIVLDPNIRRPLCYSFTEYPQLQFHVALPMQALI